MPFSVLFLSFFFGCLFFSVSFLGSVIGLVLLLCYEVTVSDIVKGEGFWYAVPLV